MYIFVLISCQSIYIKSKYINISSEELQARSCFGDGVCVCVSWRQMWAILEPRGFEDGVCVSWRQMWAILEPCGFGDGVCVYVCVCVCPEGRCGPFWNHVASMAAHTVCFEMYAKPWPLDLTLWPLKASEHASVRINLKSKEGLFLVENDLLLPMPRGHGGRLSSNHSPRGRWPGGDPHPRKVVGDLFMTSPKAACIQCVPFITTPGAPGASL